MAGDDFNDALACADVGIAMGTGTDVAMNSAQLKLVKGDLRGHATSTIFSVATVVNMKQNEPHRVSRRPVGLSQTDLV